MYNPRIWYDGDIVTSGGLNNIEQGIAQNAHDIETINDSIEDLSADAKATGDAVTELKSDLKDYNAVNVLAYGEQVTKTHNNVTFTWTDKAHCNVKCTASSHSVGLCNLFYSVSSLPSVFEKGTRYYFKYTTTQASGQRCLCDIWIFRNGNTDVNSPDVVFNVNNDIEFIMPNDATGIVIRLRLLANYTVDENINIALLSAKTNVELEKEVISAASNFGLPNYTFGSGTHNGITYSWNSDNNRCHVVGTASANSFRNVYYSERELPLGLSAGDKIGVLYNTTDEHIACRITYQLSSGYAYSPYIAEPTILTIPSDAVGMFLRLTVINGYTVDGYATVPLIFKANLQAEKIPFKAKKPLFVSFIDDDTSTDDLVTKFYQNCKHNGIVGSFAVCTKQYTDNTSTISQLLGYEYDGFNLIPHCREQKTYLQPSSADYDIVKARENYFQCLRDFATLGIKNSQNLWVIPYGSQDQETADLAKDLGFDMAFTTYGAANNYLTYNNKYGMHRCGLSPSNEVTDDTSASATGSMAKCKARIDELVASETGGWAIFTTHFNTWQNETWDATLDSNGYAKGYARFNELVQYAKSKGCEIVSMAKGAAYMKPIIDRNFTMG